MPVFFLALDTDTLSRTVEIAWIAEPSGVITGESYDGRSEATRARVEDGSTITDHILHEPLLYSCEAVVTMTPHAEDILASRGRILAKPLQTPAPYDPLRRGPPPGTPGFVTRTTMAAITGDLKPGYFVAQTLQFPIAYDPILELYQKLEKFRTSGTVLKILTKMKDYERMILTNVTLRRGQGGSGSFNISAESIDIISSATVSAPVPLEPKGEPKLSKGNQPPTPKTDDDATTQDRKSLLRSLIDSQFPGLLPGL